MGGGTINISNSSVAGSYTGGNGSEALTIENSTFTGDINAGTGGGTDAITIKGEVKSGFSLRTGNGADKIVISGTVQDSHLFPFSSYTTRVASEPKRCKGRTF